jgi:glycosyltransferase involved in cell wall biosynthesis
MAIISVIIPAWNDAAHLSDCLAALTRQTRQADEIIVVDNASADDTARVAAAAGVRVLREPSRGILRASAVGFDAATGQILARLDADSRPPADWLARVESPLASAQHPALVTGPGQFYDARQATRVLGRHLYIGGYFLSMGLLLGHPPAFGSNFAMHAEVWQRVRDRVHREIRTVHDDLDLSFQLEPGVTIVYDPTLVVGISARPFNTIRGFARRIWWVVVTLTVNWRDESLFRRRRRWRHGVGRP